MKAPTLDFSDAVFAGVEARRFDVEPPPAAPVADDLLTVPEAARELGESRQHTHRRVVSGQLEPVESDGKRFVRRAQVLDLRDALRARRAPLPKQQGEWDHARSVATVRARAVDDGRVNRLEELAREVRAMRDEFRSLRRLLMVRGSA